MKKIRNLKPEEIEVRYGNKNKNGTVNMLCYIDSRCATDLLDETYGAENWTLEYKDVAGQIYGRLSVFDEETRRWVFREDTGSESNIEAAKGLSSDILKRCIARFGCTGLYSSPTITVDEKDSYNLSVTDVQWDEKGKMTSIIICKNGNQPVFQWSKNEPQQSYYTTTSTQPVQTKTKDEWIQEVKNQCNAIWKQYDQQGQTRLKSYVEWWIKKINEKGYDGNEFNLQQLFSKYVAKQQTKQN